MRGRGTKLVAICVAAAYWTGPTPTFGGQLWSVVESPAARVITDGPPALAYRLLQELETTRSALKQVVAAEPVLPIEVFALKDAPSLAGLAPRQLKRGEIHTLGLSHTGPHTAFIALRTDRPEELVLETLRHEYAHVLTAAQSSDSPAWLDEGLAEFWGAAIVDREQVVIGRPVPRHLEQLRHRKWLPLRTMLKYRRGDLPADSSTVPMFYAQAWAMVHYALLGPGGNASLAFMPPGSALTAEFETAVPRLVTEGRFREVSMPWRPPAHAAGKTSLISDARALAERANLVVSGSEKRAALKMAHSALVLNPREPLALEVIGVYYFLTNQPQQARDWLQRAVDAGSNGYRASLYLSLLAASADERERYLTLAVASNPNSEVAWQRLRALYAQDGRMQLARRWCTQWSTQSAWLWFAYPPLCGS